MTNRQHVYEVRPRKDRRGVDLISDALPFGRLWYDEPNAIGNAIGYAKHRSRSHRAVIRVYDDAGDVTQTHEHKGDFKKVVSFARITSHNLLKRISMTPLLCASFQASKRISLSGQSNVI